MRHVAEELHGLEGEGPVRGLRDRGGCEDAVKRGQGRPQKLGDLIQRELSELIRLELRDPRVSMLTITSVDVSPDLSHAKVFFTLLQKENLEDTLHGLKRSAGFQVCQLDRR